MCGLFGMMGPGIVTQDLEFIKQLAYVSGLRGKDGTGVLQGFTYGNGRNQWVMEKGEHEVSYFIWHHEFGQGGNRNILNSVSDNFYAGHVRAATHGSLSDKNSHPFVFENIIGMHNGTLKDQKYLGCSEGRTDSECLFEDISKRGLRKVLPELDPKSAYALVIFSREDGSFYFIKNPMRPLHYMYNRKRKVFYWASEWGMLEFCADRVGLDVSDSFTFRDHHLYNFRPSEVNINRAPTWKVIDMNPLVRREVPKKEEPKPPETPKKEEPKKELTALPLQPKNEAKPILRIKCEGRKIDHRICSTCDKELDLFDIYKADKLDGGKILVCEECVKVQTEIQNFHMIDKRLLQ